MKKFKKSLINKFIKLHSEKAGMVRICRELNINSDQYNELLEYT